MSKNKLTLIPLGDSRLRLKSKNITFPLNSKINTLIKSMKDIFNSTILVGLSASQLGENYRIFMSFVRNTPARNIGKGDKLRVYINPKIIYKSREEVVMWEGCGSVAKTQIFAPVKRPRVVKIQAYDEKGEMFTLKADGLLGRVILHEMDHLDGKLFIDRVLPSQYVDKDYYIKHIKDSPEIQKVMIVRMLEINK